MSANSIGSAAVVLSANADQLLTGLNKAKTATGKWAADTSKTVNHALDSNRKAYDALIAKGHKLASYMPDVDYSKPMGAGKGAGGGIGGALAGGLAGGIAGVVTGAALDGLKTAVGLVAQLPEALKSLREMSGQGSGGPFDRMLLSLERFEKIGAQLLATVISPMAPAFERAAEIATGFFVRLQPLAASLGQRIGGAIFSLVEITGSWLNTFLTGLEAVWPILDKVFRAAEVGLFLFESLFAAVADGIATTIQAVAGWVGSWLNLDGVTLTVSQAIFKALKYVAMGAGYVWDVFKHGAGIVAEAAGHMIEALQEIAKASDELFGTDFASKLKDAGASLVKWGKEAQTGFGNSVGMFGAVIDALQAKFEERQKKIADAAHGIGRIEKVELSGVMLANSNEAYSTVTKFQVGEMFAAQNRALGLDNELPVGKDPVAIAQKQLAATQDMRRILAKIEGNTGGGQVLQVVP